MCNIINNKFNDINELIESIEMGLDIEFDLHGIRYYIGAPQGQLLISYDDGNQESFFDNAESLIENYLVNGVKLKNLINDIIIYSM